MTNEEWKKNDTLLKKALKKMGLDFRRNKHTFEPEIFFGTLSPNEVWCYYSNSPNEEYNFYVPNTVEDLGTVTMFDIIRANKYVKSIRNVFYGVKNYEELQIKLDLMA